MKLKVLVIILAVLVVLFLVGTGVNVSRTLGGDAEAAATPQWGDAVRGLLEQPLQADDVKIAFPSACRQQLQNGVFELPADGQCEMIIAEAATNLRVLPLELTAGAGADVTFDPTGGDRLTTEESLRAGDTEATISIFKEGGTLTIACAGGAACRLQVTN